MANTDRAIAASRAPVRARCPLCSAPVAPEDHECPACAASRPVAGWPRVAELVVHPGGRDPEVVRPVPAVRALPPREPQVRTVYLQPVTRPSGSHTGRLGITFLGSFLLTSALVLGTWTGLVLTRSAPPLVVPRIEVVEIERPVPVPVPVAIEAPPPAPVVAVAVRATAPPGPVEVVPLEPPPEVLPAPLPVVVAPPPPAPVRQVPPAAAALAGSYHGKAGGRPLSLHLRFQPEGVLAATVERVDGPSTLTVKASGQYEVVGDYATFMLMERGVDSPVVYSGTVTRGTAEGRMNEGGRNIGRFSVQK